MTDVLIGGSDLSGLVAARHLAWSELRADPPSVMDLLLAVG